MSIRFNKAISELNIGLQTAVDFLEKKKELGEVRNDLNFKLSDAQYEALVEAFKVDKNEKDVAVKRILDRKREKKPEVKKVPVTPTVEPQARQSYKPLGKIDLDSIGRKKVASAPVAPKVENTATTKAAAVSQATVDNSQSTQQPNSPQTQQVSSSVSQKTETTINNKAVSEQEKKSSLTDSNPVTQQPSQDSSVQEVKATASLKSQSAQQPQTEQKEGDNKSQNAELKSEYSTSNKQSQASQDGETVGLQTVNPSVQTSDETADSKSKVFVPKSELKMLNTPKLNVVGKIDLNAINQSTRPKKKSKEERRKEREEKNGQGHQNGERKKRIRINKERVDINAAAKQVDNTVAENKKNAKKKKTRSRANRPLEVDDEAVARQVKETLARLTNKQSQNRKGAKYRKEKRDAVQEKLSEEARAESKESKVLKLTEYVTVSELATMMNVSVTQVISTLMSIGIMASINQRLDAETINMVAEEFGFKTEYVSAEVQEAITEEADDESDLVPRPPIVTVMGHVDHGKTSLLDHIRNTNVIAGEAGGITQHIGAYNVKLKNGKRITFLDTPGHEAFTAMRARGAQVTDIAIIIIAADDSVMPTTKEAIAHCQAAGVPMVFAINKIDKPGANPDKIREDLANMNLLVEEWGGKYQCQEISAKKGTGVDELLDKVLLEAEMLDLKANPNRRATGSVIESSLDKGRGYISTVLVSNGTLHLGDNVIAGTSYGRVKAMFNERNQRIEKAEPSEPAIILGLNGAPTAGDSFHVLDTEQEARDIANKRLQLQREQGLRTQRKFTLDDISHRIALGEFHELNIIVKGDTDGSIEALSDSFLKLSTEKVQVNVINKAVGPISENDVMLASASDAIIVGFQVRPSADARRLADREGVEINTYSIIYDAIDDIKSTMAGMLDKVKKEVVTGEVQVKQVFHISKVGTVAGGLVTEGKVHSKDKAHVVRDGIVVHTANISALKRYKDDVKEVATGLECGISLVNYNDLQVGDIIETFTVVEVEQKL